MTTLTTTCPGAIHGPVSRVDRARVGNLAISYKGSQPKTPSHAENHGHPRNSGTAREIRRATGRDRHQRPCRSHAGTPGPRGKSQPDRTAPPRPTQTAGQAHRHCGGRRGARRRRRCERRQVVAGSARTIARRADARSHAGSFPPRAGRIFRAHQRSSPDGGRLRWLGQRTNKYAGERRSAHVDLPSGSATQQSIGTSAGRPERPGQRRGRTDSRAADRCARRRFRNNGTGTATGCPAEGRSPAYPPQYRAAARCSGRKCRTRHAGACGQSACGIQVRRRPTLLTRRP